MTTSLDVHEAAARWAEAVASAAAGAEVILTENGVPRAKLVPLSAAHARTVGLHPGAICPADDFDAPLPDEFWVGPP